MDGQRHRSRVHHAVHDVLLVLVGRTYTTTRYLATCRYPSIVPRAGVA